LGIGILQKGVFDRIKLLDSVLFEPASSFRFQRHLPCECQRKSKVSRFLFSVLLFFSNDSVLFSFPKLPLRRLARSFVIIAAISLRWFSCFPALPFLQKSVLILCDVASFRLAFVASAPIMESLVWVSSCANLINDWKHFPSFKASKLRWSIKFIPSICNLLTLAPNSTCFVFPPYNGADVAFGETYDASLGFFNGSKQLPLLE